jgi:dTDP-4-dehydrorhamnose 3,5-epimerase
VNIEALRLGGVRLVKPRIFRDQRGRFAETWRASSYADAGIGPFVQDNASVSARHVLRGLHFQHPRGQGKLVGTLRGRIFDVAVDVRMGSPTFGAWVGAELSEENGHQLYIPVGFAHGFLTLTDEAVVSYKCTEYYAPETERSLRWDDPDIGIAWPGDEVAPLLAPKDAAAPRLAEIAREALPRFADDDD